MAKFYNPGTKIDEMFSFSHDNTDLPQGYVQSYWKCVVEPESFFEIPETTKLPGPLGITDVSLSNVIKKALGQLQRRGVVLVDANLSAGVNEDDDINIAPTEAAAKKKATRLWREYLYAIAQEHIQTCEENKARGYPSRPATNLVKHALRVLGIDDPANTIDTVQRVKAEASTATDLQAQVTALMREISELKGAQNAKKAA